MTACACSWSSHRAGSADAFAQLVGLLAHRVRVEHGLDAGELRRQFGDLAGGVDCHGGSLREETGSQISMPRAAQVTRLDIAPSPGRPRRPARPERGQSGSRLAPTRVRIARTATDSVATVNASLSQISVSVCAGPDHRGLVPPGPGRSRCSGVPPEPVTVSTSLVSAACAAYRSSRSAPAGHRAPPVVPGQRGDPVPEPADLQPVGQVEVDLRGLLHRPPVPTWPPRRCRTPSSRAPSPRPGRPGRRARPWRSARSRRSSNPVTSRPASSLGTLAATAAMPSAKKSTVGWMSNGGRRLCSSQRVARSVSFRPSSSTWICTVVSTWPSRASTWAQKSGMSKHVPGDQPGPGDVRDGRPGLLGQPEQRT